MDNLKYSLKADAIGFLYRSAYNMAIGDDKMSIEFLHKINNELELGKYEILKPLLQKTTLELKKEQKLVWAEHILDIYKIYLSELLTATTNQTRTS